MKHAEYERLTDGAWYGEITGLEGLWASGPTVEESRAELRSALEDWILYGRRCSRRRLGCKR